MAGRELILPAGVRSVDPAERRGGREPQMTNRRRQMRAGQQSSRDIVNADPVYGEIGTSGLRQYGGFVLEEWLPKLRGRLGAWAYRELIDNSPIVGGVMFSIRQLARQVDWWVEDDVEVKSRPDGFVLSSMHDMSHTWTDLVSEALSMCGYGWSFHEEVMKKCRGSDPAPMSNYLPVLDTQGQPGYGSDTEEDTASELPKSEYNDGLTTWRRIPIRAQETLMRWLFQNYSSLRGMEQVDWHGGKHNIGIGKSLLFRTETTRQNPEGRSLLRNAWTSYFALQNIQTIEAIGIERDLAGIPVLIPPDGVDLSQPAYKNLLAIAEDLVQGIRRDEDEGVVLPQKGWELSLLSTGGGRQIDTDAVIRRYEQRMTVALLADFLILGQDSIGSYAMVDVKSDLFGLAVDAILDQICEVFNRYAIPRLLKLNGMSPAKKPRIRHASVGRVDLRTIGEFLSNLSIAGAPIPWTEELMRHLWRGAALPEPSFKSEDQLVQAQPSPAAHDSQWRPSWGNESQTGATPPPPPVERDHIAKAEQNTGAMIALYPDPTAARHLAQTGGEDPDELHLTLAFLGDAAAIDDPDRLRKLVEGFAASAPPITGHIAGAGVFTANAQPVSYASPDLPALPHVRQRLVEHLEHAGFPASSDHGFTPHITLGYGAAGECAPAYAHIPLSFDAISVCIGGERHDYPLTGTAVEKAQALPTDGGHVFNVAPALAERARQLSLQLEREMLSALDALGNEAGRAYAEVAQKSMTPRELQRLVGRVMAKAKVSGWVRDRLQPLLRNHAARVAGDTGRVVSQQTGQPIRYADGDVERIQSTVGQRLQIRDISPQVRDSIEAAIAAGVRAGENPLKTAQRIRDGVPAGRFTNAGVPWRAQLIARDQTGDMMRQSSLAAYKAMSNIDRVESVDGIYGPPRSDQFCIGRAGEVLPIETAALTIKSAHPLCTLGWNPVAREGTGAPQRAAA